MSVLHGLSAALLHSFGVILCLALMALAAFAERVYAEMDRFLAREPGPALAVWERAVEPRLRLSRDSAAMSASLLSSVALGGLALLLVSGSIGAQGRALGSHAAGLVLLRAAAELALALVVFRWLVPQLVFARVSDRFIGRLALPMQVAFWLVLPLTLLISLVQSIADLAEPEEPDEERPSSEAVDALLEAGEQEGILEESDRELVRSVVQFGDKVVREVMTPRPAILAVPSSMTLTAFTHEVNAHSLSRVPVYGESLDDILGIAFARDLLGVEDTEASTRAVATLAREAHFVPETKKVNELLREMQQGKQHMSIVIDEYGGVAGLVTIEDLLEAIVGNIRDEHDLAEAHEVAVPEEDGTFLIPGSFEVSRLRELFAAPEPTVAEEDAEPAAVPEQLLPQLLTGYEATTVGGLVSEIAGHIPLPGEVVEDGPLRLEVLASTDRLVERVRVGLQGSLAGSEPE